MPGSDEGDGRRSSLEYSDDDDLKDFAPAHLIDASSGHSRFVAHPAAHAALNEREETTAAMGDDDDDDELYAIDHGQPAAARSTPTTHVPRMALRMKLRPYPRPEAITNRCSSAPDGTTTNITSDSSQLWLTTTTSSDQVHSPYQPRTVSTFKRPRALTMGGLDGASHHALAEGDRPRKHLSEHSYGSIYSPTLTGSSVSSSNSTAELRGLQHVKTPLSWTYGEEHDHDHPSDQTMRESLQNMALVTCDGIQRPTPPRSPRFLPLPRTPITTTAHHDADPDNSAGRWTVPCSNMTAGQHHHHHHPHHSHHHPHHRRRAKSHGGETTQFDRGVDGPPASKHVEEPSRHEHHPHHHHRPSHPHLVHSAHWHHALRSHGDLTTTTTPLEESHLVSSSDAGSHTPSDILLPLL